MLELKQITKDYTVGEETVKALKGIDLQFRNNEFVSILGPSGCGKTTMLNIIAVWTSIPQVTLSSTENLRRISRTGTGILTGTIPSDLYSKAIT